MNLLQFSELYSGGLGSGCNPDAGKCGRPKTADDAPASVIQISNWLDDKGFPSHFTKEVSQKLNNLGMSPKLMKLPFTIDVNSYDLLKIPGSTGMYNADTKVLSISSEETNATDVVHELTHWAMFSQMPGITKPSQFRPLSLLPQFTPGLNDDTQAMMKEYITSLRKTSPDNKMLPVPDVNSLLDMSDRDANRVGAPSGYALSHPAEWVAVSAENIADGKHIAPATEKLVRNLWNGKYIQ